MEMSLFELMLQFDVFKFYRYNNLYTPEGERLLASFSSPCHEGTRL